MRVELIVFMYDSSLSPDTGPVLNLDAFLRLVEISSGGKSVQAQVVDECPTCGANDLGGYPSCSNRHISLFPLIGTFFADLSPTTFETFAPLAQGEIDITWEFV
jgi:hypothetical protein